MKKIQLTGNTLKIIALAAMTFDHVAEELMNNCQPFRIIGRLSFPLFAYMIAEGCRYTKNKRKHFFMIFLLGAGCQAVFSLTQKSLYMGILITFSLSVLLIYAVQFASHERKAVYWLLPVFALLCAAFLCLILPRLLPGAGFKIDYGFFGVLLPVMISLSDNAAVKLLLTAAGLTALSLDLGGIQWFGLFSLVPLYFYNGERGKLNMKYLFYVYYPLHLAVIYLIREFIIK